MTNRDATKTRHPLDQPSTVGTDETTRVRVDINCTSRGFSGHGRCLEDGVALRTPTETPTYPLNQDHLTVARSGGEFLVCATHASRSTFRLFLPFDEEM
jgi:hypothetical protein